MSGANSLPIGRMNPMNSGSKNVGSSLLNPTYMAMMAAQSNGGGPKPSQNSSPGSMMQVGTSPPNMKRESESSAAGNLLHK